MTGIKKTKKVKVKESAAELVKKRQKRSHIRLVRTALHSAGFESESSASDKEFTFQGVKSDFDDYFIFENIIILAEYTISQESNISDHLKNKKVLYDKINLSPPAFVEFIREKFPAIAKRLDGKYQPHQYRLKILYCSLHLIKSELKDQVPGICYYDYNVAMYFASVMQTVKRSGRFELFDFLGLSSKDIGLSVIKTQNNQVVSYPGSILPASHSNFGTDFKVVSFYVDPEALLERAYVLRKYGWRSGSTVYQRMISKKKISAIRSYLNSQERVFINNIIVTLPDSTKLLNGEGNTVDPKTILDTQPGVVQLPIQYNTIGLVDGQHRVFAYHEGGAHDEKIAKLRTQQNLLVTGIIFPPNMVESGRLEFEAKLFLEINSNQSSAKSDLKQEISLIINPFAPESIAKRVINYMNDVSGPLRDEFERYFFDKDKIKTTSVVSFAIRPLVSPRKKESLFFLWNHDDKNALLKSSEASILAAYVDFCAQEINHIMSAVRVNLPKERWTADRKQEGRFLTTTNINGIIACLRTVTASGKKYTFDEYRQYFSNIRDFNFSDYKSSQYNALGKALYDKFIETKI